MKLITIRLRDSPRKFLAATKIKYTVNMLEVDNGTNTEQSWFPLTAEPLTHPYCSLPILYTNNNLTYTHLGLSGVYN